MLISPAGPLLLQRPLVTSTAVRRVWMQSASVCIIYGGPGNSQQVVALGAGATGSPLWLELPGVVCGGDRLSPLSQAHYTSDQERNSLNPNPMDERRGGRDEVQYWSCVFHFLPRNAIFSSGRAVGTCKRPSKCSSGVIRAWACLSPCIQYSPGDPLVA